MAVVAFLIILSFAAVLSPGPNAFTQIAEGIFVSPIIVSVTVQVRVGPIPPASVRPKSDTFPSTIREPAGTVQTNWVTIHLSRG